jgi:hypothetical protein
MIVWVRIAVFGECRRAKRDGPWAHAQGYGAGLSCSPLREERDGGGMIVWVGVAVFGEFRRAKRLGPWAHAQGYGGGLSCDKRSNPSTRPRGN